MRTSILILLPLILLVGCSEKQSGTKRAETKVYNNLPAAEITREKLETLTNQTTTVIGKLRLVGSAHATRLVVTPKANFDIELVVNKAEKTRLMAYQGKDVEVEGKIEIKEYTYKDPKYNHKKYFITYTTIKLVE